MTAAGGDGYALAGCWRRPAWATSWEVNEGIVWQAEAPTRVCQRGSTPLCKVDEWAVTLERDDRLVIDEGGSPRVEVGTPRVYVGIGSTGYSLDEAAALVAALQEALALAAGTSS